MVLHIPDHILKQAGLTEREAVIEFACRLFDAEKLDLWPAAQLAGLSRAEMESELRKRKIAVYRYSSNDFSKDLETLQWLRARSA